MGLSRDQTWEALGTAEYYGPRSQMMRCIDAPTMVKDGATYGAEVGVTAALLAADGFTGAPAVTISDPSLADIWSDLGQTWCMAEQYLKPWGVCRWAQPAVAAILDMRPEIGPVPVERIEVTTFAEAARLSVANPMTTEQAQYSLPWPVAAALVTGGIAPEVLTTGLDDPEIRAVAQQVEMRVDQDMCDRFPAERLASVILHCADGRVLSRGPIAATGDPETPLSDASWKRSSSVLPIPFWRTNPLPCATPACR